MELRRIGGVDENGEEEKRRRYNIIFYHVFLVLLARLRLGLLAHASRVVQVHTCSFVCFFVCLLVS
jgi:hypothetical protein